MKLADCYRLLGLRAGAQPQEIKASYRRLARRYHPDVNPANPEQARVKFVQLTEAYQLVLQAAMQAQEMAAYSLHITQTAKKAKMTRKSPPIAVISQLSPQEQQLKASSYQSLQQLLQGKRFARAIALAEGLAQRLPQDPEVRQWQAITYQQWGRQLAGDREYDKACIYLKKALRTDPHNRSLAAEIERDFRTIDRMRDRCAP
jgi:tetratricopeptide (TPR) repeat protein